MARIYIGNLPMDVTEKDIDDVFYKFGRIVDIDLKTPARPPAFGFVTFQDVRDAEEAVRARDGYDMDGSRLRVEISRGRREHGFGNNYGGRGGGMSMGMGRGGGFGGGAMRGGAQMTEFRVIVTGLPPTASWQDLKDHMRKAGEPTYTDVDHKGGGIVHFRSRDDMEYALRKLDGSDFRNPFEKSRISVLPHRAVGNGRHSRSRSRSPAIRRRPRSRSSSRSRSRSGRPHRRARSMSRSRSRSISSPVRRRKSPSGSGSRPRRRDRDRDSRADDHDRRDRRSYSHSRSPVAVNGKGSHENGHRGDDDPAKDDGADRMDDRDDPAPDDDGQETASAEV